MLKESASFIDDSGIVHRLLFICVSLLSIVSVMKKTVAWILVLAALVGLAVWTCPDEQAHREMMKENLSFLAGGVSSLTEGNKTMEKIGAYAGDKVTDLLLDGCFVVKNRWIYSVGKVQVLGYSKRITIGVFGTVVILII